MGNRRRKTACGFVRSASHREQHSGAVLFVTAGLGVIVGLILALTGAGGGILAVPLLVFGAHQRIAEAAPIGLLAVAMAATVGGALGLRSGIVRYRAAAVVSAVGAFTSPLGLWLGRHVHNSWLTALFAGVLLIAAWRIFHQAATLGHGKPSARVSAPCLRNSVTGRLVWTLPCFRALAASGAVAGLFSGLLGVGGGFVMVPALSHYTDLDMKSVVATSLAIVALVSWGGVAASVAGGVMIWAVAIPFTTGATIGMAAGRLIADRLAGPHLQRLFALVSVVVAIALILKAAP